jgi:hypothetical protein
MHRTFLLDAFDVRGAVPIASEAHMLRNVKLAPLAIIGALAMVLTLARAQALTELAYTPAQVGKLVGGGDNGTISYATAGTGDGRSFEQLGRITTFARNSGDSPYWTYAVPVAGVPGREAWLAW